MRLHLETKYHKDDRSRPEFFPHWAATFENEEEAEKAWILRVEKHGPDYIPRPNVNLPGWVYVQWSVSNSINDFTPSTTSSPPGLRKMNRDAYFSDKFGPEIYKSLTEDVWGALLDKMNFFSMVSFSYRWSQILSQSSTCLVKILTGVRKTSPWK